MKEYTEIFGPKTKIQSIKLQAGNINGKRKNKKKNKIKKLHIHMTKLKRKK